MTITAGSLIRPPVATDFRSASSLRSTGLIIGVIGLMAAMAAFVSSLALAGSIATGADGQAIAGQAAWTFGLATAALGTIKTGIALVLLGIVRKIWVRVQSLKDAMPNLIAKSEGEAPIKSGTFKSEYGAGTIGEKAAAALPIHRMAYKLWAPMLVMGVMVVAIGLVLSFFEAQAAAANDSASFQTLRSLVPGIEFFGEALLLAGISFLLGSILGSLRQGGGEVQESLGAPVKTLKMPFTAKLFVGLMAMGMMVMMIQLVAYIVVATFTDTAAINANLTWLGPLREAGLGLILSGIVLALATIANILGFQFSRIRELIATGR